MTELEKVFREYRKIAEELHRKVKEYCHCFVLLRNQDLKESVLQEKVSEEEKKEVEEKIAELEIDIQNLFAGFLNHAKMVERTIQREKIVDFKLINALNEEHVNTMKEYNAVLERFDALKRQHPNYISNCNIDFSKMERQKQKLNTVINNFNLRFSAITKICPLYEVDDCIILAMEQVEDFYRKMKSKQLK